MLRSIALMACVTGCVQAPETEPPPPETGASSGVWTLDLIRTHPGQQAEYLRNVEHNWAVARDRAREGGAVLSYRAFVAEPDSARGWDVILMTEYADSAAYANREATFEAIFTSPDFVLVPTALPSSELRSFASSDVLLRELVAEPQH